MAIEHYLGKGVEGKLEKRKEKLDRRNENRSVKSRRVWRNLTRNQKLEIRN